MVGYSGIIMTNISTIPFELPVIQKGRGAQVLLPNRFSAEQKVGSVNIDGVRTKYINIYPKTIINEVKSPDIPYDLSMNPYQGCEHGCVYCYARPTHNYWGYDAGLSFESVILVKRDAPALFHQAITRKKWQARPVMLSGNTDCYQPIEKKLKITRKILEVAWQHRHPVSIITKNALILRDLDLLQEMAQHRLVKVAISITGIDEDMRQILEPRTSTYRKRFEAVRDLSENGIPVSVIMAPIIPSLNDHELFDVARLSAEHGAYDIRYILVRLNQEVEPVFKDWIQKHLPDRMDKVLNKIAAIHGGTVQDSRFGIRMRGEGKYADIIHEQMALARKKYFSASNGVNYDFDLSLYAKYKDPQLSLF